MPPQVDAAPAELETVVHYCVGCGRHRVCNLRSGRLDCQVCGLELDCDCHAVSHLPVGRLAPLPSDRPLAPATATPVDAHPPQRPLL